MTAPARTHADGRSRASARTLIVVHPEHVERVPGVGLDGPRPVRARPARPPHGPSRGPRPVRPADARPAELRPARGRTIPGPRRGALPYVRPEPVRARMLPLLAAAAVTFAVVSGLAVLGQGGGAGDVPVRTSVVEVGAGETVWDVAERVAPAAEAPAVVQRIRELNAMSSSAVQPGQDLRVPDGR